MASSAADIKLNPFEGFISGALAACTAVTVTNPAEVMKTRLQLDGELGGKASALGAVSARSTQAGSTTKAGIPDLKALPQDVLKPSGPGAAKAVKVYSGPIDAFQKTWKYEGIRGVQRGLGAAVSRGLCGCRFGERYSFSASLYQYTYQIALNGSRLGFYEPLRTSINSVVGYRPDQVVTWTSLMAGASSGVIGAIFGNPLFLVKARMQAYSAFNPVGAQHHYPSVAHAFRKIIRDEGPKGLVRGMDAAMLRTAMGSSVQLPAYNFAKVNLAEHGVKDGWMMYLLASTFSGSCVCAVMQPADTALTRMYNQSPNSLGPDGKPRGLLYKNPIDCLYKTWKAEGIRGLYKGTTAHLMRVAPHTIVTLVANEQFSRRWIAYKKLSIIARD
ncbi:BZ3500_MvSof-1268-A1-R1_Chr3-1g06099 [Microbotryum saponariae]|uniref:BZ3500_MvSof-1268-A1-R1_Chr3-1g06099 protein n=1 Tax=Microbotryum saponariae TaxID=289078 RepID=A0A2X0N9C7_9BASI|nr:BZ3500_MvSof-1268-A1-R1_Chr3-1g06099 [Microbotryum saponariae]SDA03962.1 BZ3501_MvSof-1269-A2-R1_Chr3-2g05784 [Microbotryum saponariae]